MLTTNNTIEEIINNYFARIEVLLSSNMIQLALANSFADFLKSNYYIKDASMRINGPYVIRPALNQTYATSEEWYESKIH
jgi:hypothetical protein